MTHELKLTTGQLALLYMALQSYSNCPREHEAIAIKAMKILKLALGQEPTPQTLTERLQGGDNGLPPSLGQSEQRPGRTK